MATCFRWRWRFRPAVVIAGASLEFDRALPLVQIVLMDADKLDDHADDPRLGHPYFDGVDEMVTAWAWHLLDADPAAPTAQSADDGFSRRFNMLGAAPEMGELIVPKLHLPHDLPAWCGKLLVCFLDVLVQDEVARIWDGGGPAAVTAHLAHYDLTPDALEMAIADDMFFLGMIAMEVMHEVLDVGDRIRVIATCYTG